MSLVVEGAPTWRAGVRFLALGVLLGLAGVVLIDLNGTPPWLAPMKPEAASVIIFAGSTVTGLLVMLGLRRRSMALAGRVVLDEREISFKRSLWRTTVPYSDLDGFKDGHAEYIELVRGPGVGASFFFRRLTIPTPDETLRVAVLAALDARGIRRLER